jgi:uncharacterized membrane protein
MLADPQPPPLTDAQASAIAEQIVAAAYRREDERRRRQPLPRWLGPAMRALPRVLAIVTIANGLIGLLAVATPVLTLALGEAATRPLYRAYALICPQRDSHTWFIAGEPMAMEQRMVAMYLAAGLAGALYIVWSRLRRPLPVWAMLLGVAPALIDVAISTAGVRPSTPSSRLWTGVLAAFVLVWWSYPRFEQQLREVQSHVARLRGGAMPE